MATRHSGTTQGATRSRQLPPIMGISTRHPMGSKPSLLQVSDPLGQCIPDGSLETESSADSTTRLRKQILDFNMQFALL